MSHYTGQVFFDHEERVEHHLLNLHLVCKIVLLFPSRASCWMPLSLCSFCWCFQVQAVHAVRCKKNEKVGDDDTMCTPVLAHRS